MFERTLIISPHCDDETIGCGGLISSLACREHVVKVLIVASHTKTYNYSVDRVVSNDERLEETKKALKLLGLSDSDFCQLEGFSDGELDMYSKKDIVSAIDSHIREFKPTAVLFPYSSHHQDHQIVYQASVAALRPCLDTNFIKLKAMYEYPYINSWGSNVNPDSKLYYPLTEKEMMMKKTALELYKSQLCRDRRDILSVESIMRLAEIRGTEIGVDYAEVFYPMSIIGR